MKMKLPSPPYAAMRVFMKLVDSGFEAFFVGGCVRDRILGRRVNDWDIATNATPSQVLPLFDHVIETGIQHGTVTVIEDGEHFEVTTYRIDGDYTDGRRPDGVSFTKNIVEDLARRDFTINAMAWDPSRELIVDPFGGQLDILRKLIRTVGDASERFEEDGLRSMRAIRFASVLDFNIEENTRKAISRSYETFRRVAFERIQVELVKILASGNPETGVFNLFRNGLFQILGGYDSVVDELYKMALCPRRLAVQLVTLCEISKVEPKRFMELFKFPAELTKRVIRIGDTLKINPEVDTDAQVRELTGQIGRDILADVFDWHISVLRNEGWRKFRNRVIELNIVADPLTIKELAINGDDVIRELGLKSGKEVGDVLKKLMKQVWQFPSLNDEMQLLRLLPHVHEFE